jgi:HK97 family phage portal protein
MRWPWSSRAQEPSNTTLSIADPALAALFTPGGWTDIEGVTVGEYSALGLSAVYRAVNLVAGTLASLPFKSFREDAGGIRQTVPSIFDDPDPGGQTQYEWTETAFAHLMLYGKAGALKIRTEAGGLAALPLVHPSCFRVELPTLEEYSTGVLPAGGLWFCVSLANGEQVRLDADGFWYVPGLAMDGKVGAGLLTYARMSLATSIAGDKAAGNTFANGALMAGLATPADDADITDDVPEIKRQLNNNVLGHANAGTIAVVNRRLTFTPWVMSNTDAQFLESRSFQIEEVARLTGVPPHLLMSSEKSTSWGTGLEEQNRAMARTVLAPWANRFEQRASRLLARPRWAEFDFHGLERPAPDVEIGLLIQQVQAGLLTVDEARAIRNLPPLPDPDAAEDNRGDDSSAEEVDGDDDAATE